MLPATTAPNPTLATAAAPPARSEALFFVRVAYVCAAIAIIVKPASPSAGLAASAMAVSP